MATAKDIKLKVIPSRTANEFVKRHHYSNKVVQNSTLHFGVFLNGILHGVMQFGSPLDKRKVLPLVHTQENKPCLWNEMLELNRMAFDDVLPKNSESRAIAIAIKLLKKNAPHIKWILSFADGTQCGDGTIYRASGFVLTGIRKNNSIWALDDVANSTDSRVSLTDGKSLKEQAKAISRTIVTKGKHTITDIGTLSQCHKQNGKASMKLYIEMGYKPLEGFQFRYIYLIDKKNCRLTVPNIPFSKINEMGAGMYKGQKRETSIVNDADSFQELKGGVIPTVSLQ